MIKKKKPTPKQKAALREKQHAYELEDARKAAVENRAAKLKAMAEEEAVCGTCCRETPVAHSPEFGYIGHKCLVKRLAEVQVQ